MTARSYRLSLGGLAVLGLLVSCCRKAPGGDHVAEPMPDLAPPDAELYLHVSPGIRADLALVDKEYYLEPELAPLFTSLASAGDDYCRMFYGQTPRDERTMAAFINPGWRYWSATAHSKWNSRAGCWNFFRMNDRHPGDDFDLVRRLYPATAYDCYAIGFPQPYIMHDRLGCRTLTMVDFSWRIQDGHRTLLALGRGNQLARAGSAALAELPLTWLARPRRTPRPRDLNPHPRLCTTREECEAALVSFPASSASIEKIQLSLAALHEMEFLPRDRATPRIIYLSNALDRGYTSEPEFWLFMANLSRAMKEGDTAVLVYHAGNRADFALYEVTVNDGKYAISLRCHDIYQQPAGQELTSMTWPDRFVESHDNIPACHTLLELGGYDDRSSSGLGGAKLEDKP